MNFNNKDIVCDEWNVKYATDAFAIFERIADTVYPKDESDDNLLTPEIDEENTVEESYCWTIWNKKGETELYSGFNSFLELVQR